MVQEEQEELFHLIQIYNLILKCLDLEIKNYDELYLF